MELFGGFLVEDDTRNIFFDARRGEKHISISSSVVSIVLQVDSLELLFHRARGLVSSKNTLAWGADLMSSLDQFL